MVFGNNLVFVERSPQNFIHPTFRAPVPTLASSQFFQRFRLRSGYEQMLTEAAPAPVIRRDNFGQLRLRLLPRERVPTSDFDFEVWTLPTPAARKMSSGSSSNQNAQTPVLDLTPAPHPLQHMCSGFNMQIFTLS